MFLKAAPTAAWNPPSKTLPTPPYAGLLFHGSCWPAYSFLSVHWPGDLFLGLFSHVIARPMNTVSFGENPTGGELE